MNVKHQNEFKPVPVRRHDCERAFTLTELLVVLTTLGILAVVLLPALAGNQPGTSRAFQCLNNMRQLGLADSLYANDNHDKLASNSDEYPPMGGENDLHNWICPGGVRIDWSAGSYNTNTLFLTVNSPVLGTALFGSYVVNSVNIYVCPADKYLSGFQQGFSAAGWTHRLRSCAMNGAMGDGVKYFGFNDVTGQANAGHSQMPTFYTAKKITSMHSPGPSNCWLLMDEHPDSDDDVVLYVNPADASGTGTAFTELPGSMHNNAAGMVFADGHSVMHVWQGRITTQPVRYVAPSSVNRTVSSDPASQNDLTWLAQHTPAN